MDQFNMFLASDTDCQQILVYRRKLEDDELVLVRR